MDAAGNRSPESTPIDFTVDTSAVAISIEQALDNVGPNQDPLASGSVTDDATPTLRGQATPGSTVNIYLDGVLLQEGVAVNNAGRWEYEVNPPLPEGSYAFTATVVTAAGGESAPTAEFNLEIDLTPRRPRPLMKSAMTWAISRTRWWMVRPPTTPHRPWWVVA